MSKWEKVCRRRLGWGREESDKVRIKQTGPKHPLAPKAFQNKVSGLKELE